MALRTVAAVHAVLTRMRTTKRSPSSSSWRRSDDSGARPGRRRDGFLHQDTLGGQPLLTNYLDMLDARSYGKCSRLAQLERRSYGRQKEDQTGEENLQKACAQGRRSSTDERAA